MNLYEVLGVTQQSTPDEIKKAYKKLSGKWHPDRNPGDPEAVEKFKQIQEAWSVLGNQEKRTAYDRFGTTGNRKPYTSAYDDFFSQIFGEQRRAVARGADVHVEIPVTFEQVLKGGDVEMTYQQRSLCGKCGGRGGTEGKCGLCDGTGARLIQGQNMTVRTSCPACKGKGRSVVDACGECQGGFTEPTEKKFNFKVMPGVEHGMRFHYPGWGDPSPDPNGQPGSLYAQISVKDHAHFRRQDNGNLLLFVPVAYHELVLGADIEVPTPDSKVSVKVPPGTAAGSKMRLKGLGLPVFNNSETIYEHGDLYLRLVLAVPPELTDDHRSALERLAQIEGQAVIDRRQALVGEKGETDGKPEDE